MFFRDIAYPNEPIAPHQSFYSFKFDEKAGYKILLNQKYKIYFSPPTHGVP